MAKNSWFKHYNTASEGNTIQSLWDAGRYETICLYWKLLELISRWEDENNRGKISINFGTIARITGWKLDKIERELTRLRSDSLSIVIRSSFDHDLQSKLNRDTIIEISSSNWLELQETRGGKRESKIEQRLSKTPTEVRSKNKEEDNTTTNAIDEINLAWGVWCETLKSFNLKNQPISVYQQSSLARAIKTLGIETVCLALEGQRYEKSTDSWNPKDHLSIDRVLHRDAKGQQRWEKFANMAIAKRELQKTKLTDEELQAEGRGF